MPATMIWLKHQLEKEKEKKKKTNDLYLPIFLYFFARSLLSCSIVFLPLCCPVILRARRSITLLGHFLLFFFGNFPQGMPHSMP